MKFFLPSNVPAPERGARKSDAPSVRVTRTGTFVLSTLACQLLDVKAGDKVALSQDDEGEFYITKNIEGFELRGKNESKLLVFQNKYLVDKIMGNVESKSVRYLIAKEPTMFQKQPLYAILTSSKK
jgi:hypothetical protein